MHTLRIHSSLHGSDTGDAHVIAIDTDVDVNGDVVVQVTIAGTWSIKIRVFLQLRQDTMYCNWNILMAM